MFTNSLIRADEFERCKGGIQIDTEENKKIKVQQEDNSFRYLSVFLKENPDIRKSLANILESYPENTKFQFSRRMWLIGLLLLAVSALTYYGKITGSTLSGFVGIVVGYLMGKGKI